MTFEEVRRKTIDTFRSETSSTQDEVDLIGPGCMAMPIYYQIRRQSRDQVCRPVHSYTVRRNK